MITRRTLVSRISLGTAAIVASAGLTNLTALADGNDNNGNGNNGNGNNGNGRGNDPALRRKRERHDERKERRRESRRQN
jgi:hypothetical protein